MFECKHVARRSAGKNDEVTLADCNECLYKPKIMSDKPRVLILRNYLSPGDVLCMTAAVYSLHKQHPGKFVTAVDTSCPALWQHNPDIETVEKAREMGGETVQCHYPAIQRYNQEPLHFLHGYAEFLQTSLQAQVPLATNRPMVYLSREEREWLNQVQERTGYKGKFWLVNSGTKKDFTAKQYPYFQEVVDRLQGKVVFVQVGKKEHLHRPLKGVIDLLDQTDDRQFVRLAYHAQGVLCGVTFLMHLAAALEKPAVVVAGAREPRSWNTYPRQVLLNNVGALSCCASAACWRSRTIKMDDNAEQNGSLCEMPILTDPPAPKCMTMIDPQSVADAVLSYYHGGVLQF